MRLLSMERILSVCGDQEMNKTGLTEKEKEQLDAIAVLLDELDTTPFFRFLKRRHIKNTIDAIMEDLKGTEG